MLLISCPFDYVDVFDGPDNESTLIGKYCGQQRNLVLYSTEHSLFVTFTTLNRFADSQNRGFIGFFQFSETFVKLGTHIFPLQFPVTLLVHVAFMSYFVVIDDLIAKFNRSIHNCLLLTHEQTSGSG